MKIDLYELDKDNNIYEVRIKCSDIINLINTYKNRTKLLENFRIELYREYDYRIMYSNTRNTLIINYETSEMPEYSSGIVKVSKSRFKDFHNIIKKINESTNAVQMEI